MEKSHYQTAMEKLDEKERFAVRDMMFTYMAIAFVVGAIVMLMINIILEVTVYDKKEETSPSASSIEEIIQSTRDPNMLTPEEIAQNPIRFARDYDGQVITITPATVSGIHEEYFTINMLNIVALPKDPETIFDLNVGTSYTIRGTLIPQLNEYTLEYYYLKDAEIIHTFEGG